MTPKFAENLQAYADAKNRHAVEEALTYCTEDCVYETVSTGQRFAGRDELRGYYTALWQAIPDYHADFEDVAYADDAAVVWGRVTGTLEGDQLGLPATGAPLDFPIVFVCTFRDGLLARDRGFYDMDQVLRQSGLHQEDRDAAARAFVKKFQEAHEARTGEALAALFHSDAEISYPTEQVPIGPPGVRDFWDNGRLMIPDLEVRTLDWAARGSTVFVEWEASGTVEGVHRSWRGADRFSVRDGLALAEGNYWDTAVLRPLRESASALLRTGD